MSEKLNVYFNSTNYSEELTDFLEETQALTITNSDYIYFGLNKPFNNLYFYYDTPNSSKVSFTVEYYDGSSWQNVINLNDDTKKQTRSGFVSWQEADDNTDIEEVEINSITQYWYRFQPASTVNITAKAFGVIFSQDRDIFQTRPVLNDTDFRTAVVSSDTDYMRVHLETKEDIIQNIRNKGIKKYQNEDDPDRLKFYRNINEWDLFDIDEVKVAAKNLALAKIYYSLSDNIDDKWYQEATRFNDVYNHSIDYAMVSLDKNNDGKLQEFENIQPIRNSRIMR